MAAALRHALVAPLGAVAHGFNALSSFARYLHFRQRSIYHVVAAD